MLVVFLLKGTRGYQSGGYYGNAVVTNLLQQVINVKVHFENRFLPALVMQCNDKRSRGR